MTIYTIYKITNKLNQKCYIGFSRNYERRWKQHCYLNARKRSRINNAIRKYGKENFLFEVLYQSREHKHTLMEIEPLFIKEHNSILHGYNVVEAGQNTNTDDMRKASSIRMTKNNPMHGKIPTNAFPKGHKPIITPERNEKVRQSKLGAKNPNFGNKNAANHLNSKIHTCTHCGIITTKGNIVRWHGDNCKSYSITGSFFGVAIACS